MVPDPGAELCTAIDRAAERTGRNAAKCIDAAHEIVLLARLKRLHPPPDDAYDKHND